MCVSRCVAAGVKLRRHGLSKECDRCGSTTARRHLDRSCTVRTWSRCHAGVGSVGRLVTSGLCQLDSASCCLANSRSSSGLRLRCGLGAAQKVKSECSREDRSARGWCMPQACPSNGTLVFTSRHSPQQSLRLATAVLLRGLGTRRPQAAGVGKRPATPCGLSMPATEAVR